MNYPFITKIIDTKKETNNIRTIKFYYNKETKPGQFYMIWIPGIDEIPMSVSYIDKKIKGITFRVIGDATRELFKLKDGDKIGIRGPFGNGFKIEGEKILFVAGGTGIAMIAPTAESINNKKMTVILGVKSKDELFFKDRIKKTNADLIISTDDGTCGCKGYACDVAIELIKKEDFDLILTCGPEVMMKKLYDYSKNIAFQASLERFMKCGIGLCGQCCVGEGLRVCSEGPIFNREQLNKIDDFGKFKRDATGKRIKI